MAATRKCWVGGNWKCHGTRDMLSTLVKAFNALEFDRTKTDVVIFPSDLYVAYALDKLDHAKFMVGVQNFSQESCGAFTGEIATAMLKDLDIQWSLVGHSERRSMFGETDELVAHKVEIAQKEKIHTAVCIGENLEEREADHVADVLKRQLSAFVDKVTDWSLVVIAYEPLWAIGTGKVAKAEQVREAHEVGSTFNAVTGHIHPGCADEGLDSIILGPTSQRSEMSLATELLPWRGVPAAT